MNKELKYKVYTKDEEEGKRLGYVGLKKIWIDKRCLYKSIYPYRIMKKSMNNMFDGKIEIFAGVDLWDQFETDIVSIDTLPEVFLFESFKCNGETFLPSIPNYHIHNIDYGLYIYYK